MLKKILILGASSLSLLSPAFAHAEDGEDVIVTVTREALPVSKIGQAVDILTDADIKSYQSLSVSDLLARTTDLHTIANGGPGASGASSIRGSGADQVLYLLDGIALNDPSQVGGGFDLGVLSTGDAERIEVLRGPLSTLWGSGAVGGVVSITTRRATKPLEGDLAIEGFDHYGAARLRVGGKSGGLNWRVFASGLNDRGVSAAASGTEADGFTQTQLSARASYALTDAVTLTGLAAKTHNYSEVDGYDPVFYTFGDADETSLSDTTLAAIGLTAKYDAIEHTLSVSATETERNLFDATRTPTFEGRGRSLTADYHLTYRASDATRLLAGLRHQQDEMRTESTYTPQQTADQDLTSVYGQVRHDFGTASVAVSARHDESSSFGGQDIVQASVAVPAGPWRFRASAGQGVKVPSLYQLYSDYGNAGLKPEKAVTVDGGFDYSFASGQVSVTAFTRNIDNLIGFDSCYPATAALCATHPYGFYSNIDKSEASGLELEWTQDVNDRLHIHGNLTSLNTRNESVGLEGKELARKPNLLANFDLSYDVSDAINLAIGVRHAGDAFDNASNTVKLDAYTLTDLRARYQLSEAVELYARIENLTDQRYQTAAGYGQLGRRLWVGVRTRLF